MNEPIKVVYPKWLTEYEKRKDTASDVGDFTKRESSYKPKLLLNDDRFLIMDWENTENSEYSFYYFFRKDIGLFHMLTYRKHYEITANWFHKLKLSELLYTMKEAEYFAAKVVAGDESLFGWNDTYGLEALQKDREEKESFYGEDVEAMEIVMKDYDEMERLFKEFGAAEVDEIAEFRELWYKYHDNWTPPGDLGGTISAFVYWGLKGFFESCEKTGLITLLK